MYIPRLLETHLKSLTTPGNQIKKSQVSSKLPWRVWDAEKVCICWQLVSQKPDVLTAGTRRWE